MELVYKKGPKEEFPYWTENRKLKPCVKGRRVNLLVRKRVKFYEILILRGAIKLKKANRDISGIL